MEAQQQQQLQQTMLVTGIDSNNQEVVTQMEQQQQQLSSLVTPLTVLSPLTAVSSSINTNMSLDESATNTPSGILMTAGASSSQAAAGSGGIVSSTTNAFSYDDLFPALPTNNAPPVSNIIVPGCVRVTSTQMTQVKKY